MHISIPLKRILIFWSLCCFINLHAQTDIRNILFSGKVHDDASGIAGVAVTDGINITHTDAKGQYKLLSNATAEFVYITLPSGYDVPLKNGIPCFYVPVNDKFKSKQTINFELKKSAKDDYHHTMISWADPQIYFDEELPLLTKAAKDVEELALQSKTPVYGVVCGDIVGDHPEFYNQIKTILADTRIPFFFTPGNHDMTLNVRSNDLSKDTFKKTFGPDYYSFNRGKIHYIALDNPFYVGRTYWYIAYLPEQQLTWLKQDLANVPAGSTVVVFLHIPTSTHGTQTDEKMLDVLQNRQYLHELLKPFNAHIFSGHTHYNDNFVINEHLYEHVHASVCGEFWQALQCSDGTPQGYGVYEINGDSIQWYYKSIGYDKDFQFRAYPVGYNPEKPNAVTVNVWNYDPQWKILWYENGVLKGEMTQYQGLDPYATDYIVKNKQRFRHQWISTGITGHLFFAELSSPEAEIIIEVIDRFGNKYIKELGIKN
jgi:hypothetical protein